MYKTSIPLKNTGKFPEIVLDYLDQDQNLRKFYSLPPDISSFSKAIDSRNSFNTDRSTLVSVLESQYQSLFSDVELAVYSNIRDLKKENTYTVTTGHQLNILTGPLFSIYKIITTINTAARIKEAYPEINVVPVFWMASEDHDLAEIDHTYINNIKYQWQRPSKGISGHLSPNGIDGLMDIILKDFPELAYTDVFGVIQNAYAKHNDLATATFEIVNYLFGKYGLVVINADHKDLKKLFESEIKNELLEGNVFREVSDTVTKLNKKYKLLVNPREINLFYINKDSRNRIVKQDRGKWVVADTEISFSESQLMSEFKLHPERFSPNVIMRTIYQERILPNLAYIGGPGEISYWLQFKSAFDSFGIPFPILLLRNSILLADYKAVKKLNKLNLQWGDIFNDIHSLENRLVLSSSSLIDPNEIKSALTVVYDKINFKANEIDPTLDATVKAEHTKVNKGIDKIYKKMLRNLKKENEVSLRHLHELKQLIFPDGVLQERKENFLPYYLSTSGNLIDMLIKNTDPFSSDLLVFELD